MIYTDAAELADALDAGFREDTAEKVLRLLEILRDLESFAETKGRFTLKGGTALNVFHLEGVPRLSVDIDLIATGFPDAAPRSGERQRVIKLVEDRVKSLGYKTQKDDSEDSGCTIYCNYRNALGTPDQVKIDLDFVGRETFLATDRKAGPKMFSAQDLRFPTLAPAELLAQKLVAVAYRAHARDLYDMQKMLTKEWHKLERARELYLAQSFLKDFDWYRLDYPIKLALSDYRPELLEDVLRRKEPAPTLDSLRTLARAALHPRFTVASEADHGLRKALLAGDLTALGRIAGETRPEELARLARSPALLWRLEQAKKQGKTISRSKE